MTTILTHEQIQNEHRYGVRTPIANLSSGNRDALKSILLVGARQDDQGYLSLIDTYYLRAFLLICAEFRWPLHPCFTIARTNIDDDKADDFLKLDTPFDAVLFCYLFHQEGERAISVEHAQRCARKHSVESDTYLQSLDHHEAEKWHARLREMNAKVVGNIKSFVTDLDLPNEWLSRDPYGNVAVCTMSCAATRKLHLFASREWGPARPQFDALTI